MSQLHLVDENMVRMVLVSLGVATKSVTLKLISMCIVVTV